MPIRKSQSQLFQHHGFLKEELFGRIFETIRITITTNQLGEVATGLNTVGEHLRVYELKLCYQDVTRYWKIE
jgi:hypothetical protein